MCACEAISNDIMIHSAPLLYSGLYDIHIHLKHIPFLEPEVPTIAERHEIVAGQVMSTEVKW